MSIQGCLVIQRPGSIDSPGNWQIIVGDKSDLIAASVSVSDLAARAKSMIQVAEIKNANVVLAPSSTACFFIKLIPSVDIDGRDRAALTYELEDHLPIDAESMVADFVAIDTGTEKSFGALAIPIHPWKSIADAFESIDLPVRSIVPAAVLATRALDNDADPNEVTRWLLIDDSRCDCMCVRDEKIVSWKHLSVDVAALRRQLLLDEPNVDRTVVVGADATQVEMLRSIQPNVQVEKASVDSLVRDGAQLLLDNRSQHWFDLRRDALGPSDPLRAISKQLRWVGLAAALCFLALAMGGWWRSNRIETEIASVQAMQADLYRQAFPDARIRGAVLTGVRSEHRRVTSSRGQNLDVEIPPSSTMILRRILAALPEDVRFRIDEINIENGVATITLLAKKSEDISQIANAIQAVGFRVPPPGVSRPEDNENQWSAKIEATWIKPKLSEESS